MKIAFAGASGTGKTTMAKYIEDKYGIPYNPVGSRSVAKQMGFDSPYDVDRAGKRAEFQQLLFQEKLAWESAHDSFVTDRTAIDNLVYYVLHDVRSITPSFWDEVMRSVRRYDVVFYCPVQAFCDPGQDAARVADLIYHRVYDALLEKLLDDAVDRDVPYYEMRLADLDQRCGVVDSALSGLRRVR